MKQRDFLSGFSSVTPKQWKQKIVEELKGKSFDDLIWHPEEGFDIQPFYTAEDLEKIKKSVEQKSKPGWEIRQDFIVKDLEESNKDALDALSGGSESIGFDVSKVDITKSHLQKLLAGINTSKHPVHFTGVKIKSLEKLISVFTKKTSGSVEFSDFSEKNIPTLVAYSKRFPAFDFITIKAHSLQNIAARTPPLLQRGGRRVRLVVSLSIDYFLSIARLRAIRLFFAEKKIPVFIHAENTLQKTPKGEEHYNILRATTIAMSAVIGGCDSLYLKSAPMPGKSKANTERIYRNIQLLLKHESYLDKVADMAGGSYYIEVLMEKMIASLRKETV